MNYSPILMMQKTNFFTLGAQQYMSHKIKKPILDSLDILFTDSSKIKKAKALKQLWEALEALKGLPEPTKENTWHPNTHTLIDLRDWLLERCKLDRFRTGLIRRLMNFVIILYDFDPPWRWIMDSLKDEAFTKEWKPRGFNDTWTWNYPWWKE